MPLQSELLFASFPKVQAIIRPGADQVKGTSGLIRSSFRPRRKDRCAIFVDGDKIREFLNQLDAPADYLERNRNIHWTGFHARGERRWKRIVVGDYFNWFIWYMQFHRFGAFHNIILIDPIEYMMEADRKGYIDGLLTRLLTYATINKVIIIESEENRRRLLQWLSQGEGGAAGEDRGKFARNELQQLTLSLLCGTRLTATQLVSRAERSYWFSVNRDSSLIGKELTSTRWLYERTGPFYKLSEDALRVLQCLNEIPDSYEKFPPEMDQLFRVRHKLRTQPLEYGWLKEQVRTVAGELGFFTIPILSLAVNEKLLKLAKEGDFPRRIISQMEYMNDDERREALLPSFKLVRKMAEELAAEEMLVKRTWYLEVGRPAVLYALPERVPMNEQGRCGQCAFYVSLKRRCKLWWLLNARIGHFPDSWGDMAPRVTPSQFELYKMKNSRRISPHSSACQRFLDKRRDYRRKETPENCDVCSQPLARQGLTTCMNCGTHYVQLAKAVRVYTSYDHEFRAKYRELTGRDPRTDESAVYSRFSGGVRHILEKQEFEERRAAQAEFDTPMIVLYPGDPFELHDDLLIVSKRSGMKRIPMVGLTVVDYGRLSEMEAKLFVERGVTLRRVQRYPEVSAQLYFMEPKLREALEGLRPQLTKIFAIAMAQSAINATRRIATPAQLKQDLVQRTIRDQAWFLQRDESTSLQSSLLTNEAMIMKGYWACYDTALDMVFSQFGPRKKSRFVREHIADPAGRAKGYTAVDAAINYMHQRRLLKCGTTNAELGLGWVTGDGILHRRSKNSRDNGLLLDLADPVKFADREVLLHAFLDYRLNWRDFRLAWDRKGINYYYPSSAAVRILEELGEEADNLAVTCGQGHLGLVDAYRTTTIGLVNALRRGNIDSFAAFVFGQSNN